MNFSGLAANTSEWRCLYWVASVEFECNFRLLKLNSCLKKYEISVLVKWIFFFGHQVFKQQKFNDQVNAIIFFSSRL